MFALVASAPANPESRERPLRRDRPDAVVGDGMAANDHRDFPARGVAVAAGDAGAHSAGRVAVADAGANVFETFSDRLADDPF
jgi:hypothetical protein